MPVKRLTKSEKKKKQPRAKKKVVKLQPSHELKLTIWELLHLRDLMSMVLPPEMSQTASQSLAIGEERILVEATLWNKVVATCKEVGIPLDEDAPDFVITICAPAPLGVFKLEPGTLLSEEEDDSEELHDEEEEDEDS